VEVRVHESVDEFRALAEPLYRRDPVGNTIELTVLNANTFGDDALLLTVWNRGLMIGAALQTPPYPLACNGIPTDESQGLAEALARINPHLSGARGERGRTLAFADAWREATGRGGSIAVEERLYRLGVLTSPTGVLGGHRDADHSDAALLVDWVQHFFIETFSHHRDATAGRRFVEHANAAGDRFVLWQIDGAPVSMAMLRAPSAGVSRIGPVFTPQKLRGHGYGSAVTAAASELARRGGADDVVLFADLANPTSNAIYQRLGFEAVADSVRVEFDG
jgi:GNAT superfamily N-acetyltransferase